MKAQGYKSRKRLLVVLGVIVALFCALIARDAYWSLARGAELKAEAEDQWISDITIPAQRGSILDRNGNTLAQSAGADSVVLLPQEIADPSFVAHELAVILEMDEQELLSKASTKTRVTDSGEERDIVEVWVKRQITTDQSEQISALQLAGVKLTDDVKRYYPNKDFATQLIGYTSMDGDGQTGIERRFNAALEGRAGRVVAETDKMRNEIPDGEEMTIEPVDGVHVVLTIDEILQRTLEAQCQEALDSLNADSVQGLILHVPTRELLAMANLPEFDLNEPPRSDPQALASESTNVVTGRSYVPGALFTYFVAAAVLDASEDRSSYTCSGAEVINGAEINCFSAHGTQTFAEAVQNGCLIASAHMASDLGKESFYSYLEAFGFGEKTGIDLPSDAEGYVMEMKYASDSELARMGAGASIEMTQLQLANGIASILDDGQMKIPQIVLELQNTDGSARETYEAQTVGNSVSAATAGELTDILASSDAVASGYSGGLLSASALQPHDSLDSPVSRAVTMAVAFAPAENPEYLVLMAANSDDESSVSASRLEPLAAAVLGSVMQYENRQPDADVSEHPSTSSMPAVSSAPLSRYVTVPRLVGYTLEEAVEAIEAAGLTYRADGTGTVEGQVPYAGDDVERGSVVRLEMSEKAPEASETESSVSKTVVPDFRGMSFREAMDAAADADVIFLAQGTGVAVAQSPVAGATVEKGTSVTVTFRIEVE